MNADVKIFAHRGGMARAPENTIAAFRQALADRADAFECDVRLTKDHEPVLIHTKFDDDDIQPVTGGKIPLRELNWVDLQKQRVVNSNEPVAHLDEALAFVQETGLPCFIEPKESSQSLLEIVIDRIRRFNVLEKVGVLTFYSRRASLIQAKQIEPTIETSVILINPFTDFVKAARSIPANRVIIGWSPRFNHSRLHDFFFSSLTRRIEQLKANGVAVEGGFIAARHDVKWALRHGIHGLWTNDVPKIRRYVEEMT
jgi:glycerophosphoryl diester phosphodiesterase